MVSRGLCGFPDFAWAVGEEGSDPVVLREGVPYRHDQFAASRHYDLMQRDLDAVASLGVQVYRYGMPWRLTEPEPGVYDWDWWDRALGACARAGLVPVVDLCHFGLPDHSPGFCDASWVEGFCRYVDAFLARYPEPRWFTPVNEPGGVALASGLLGGWNDRRSSTRDYALALTNVVRANLEALARIRADRDGCWIGAEVFEVPIASTPADEPRVTRRRERSWLIWDLHFGVEPSPGGRELLRDVPGDTLARIADLATTEHLIAGHDVYPTSVYVVGDDRASLTIADRLDAYVAEARRWYERYRVPFWVAETSNLSLPVADQSVWLDAMVEGLEGLRADGVPVRGLCWYSRGDQYDWQTLLMEPTGAVTEVGLFDAERRARPVAARWAHHCATNGR